MIDLRGAHGADLSVRNSKGKTLLDEMRRRGSDDLTDALRARGARTSQELGG